MDRDTIDSFFYGISRVVDAIYQDEALSDILYFICSIGSEATAGMGSTIRVLEQGTFDLKVVSSYGLSEEYLDSGAIDHGKSVTEVIQGDVIIINDFENDSRVQNRKAARNEGISSVIGIPFTVNETTYSILRVYFPDKKIPSQEEMELLDSLGKLSCLAIEHAAISNMR
ncbi:MAG: GAF domain-containing protein [Desulfobacterales bacterium]|nr:GAF domain-containing protein [Desulfobacterales bacterium]